MSDLIASRKNPLIRRIRKLDSDAAFRRRDRCIVVTVERKKTRRAIPDR